MSNAPQAIAGQLEHWLQKTWPLQRNIRIHDLQPPDQGYSNETWLLRLDWTCNDQPEHLPLVLRLQPEDIALFPSYDLSLQYRCMERLANSDVPVPRLLGFADNDSPLGRPFYLMQQLPGRVPRENPLYHLEGWLHDLPLPRQRAVWLSGVEMIARINRLDWKAADFDFLNQRPAGESPLDQQLRELRGSLEWAESLAEPYPHLRAALHWLESHRPHDEPIALCWGDPKLGNCLFDPETDACTGVLDWEAAHLGNPADDLAWWIILDRSMCDGYGVTRLPGLPSRAYTIAHWERHTGQTALNLEYYEVFCAFKFALIMARIGCLFMKNGLVPQEQRMDLNNGGSSILRIIAGEQGLPFA